MDSILEIKIFKSMNSPRLQERAQIAGVTQDHMVGNEVKLPQDESCLLRQLKSSQAIRHCNSKPWGFHGRLTIALVRWERSPIWLHQTNDVGTHRSKHPY